MFLDFVHRLTFSKNTTFQKLDLFPSSGKTVAAPTLLGPLERAGINRVGAAIILTEDGDGVS
jgi:hypothetical protein